MTPFELWRAGRGEEPVVVADLPVMLASAKSWRWLPIQQLALRPGPPGATAQEVFWHGEDERMAAEECRAALATALFFLRDRADRPPLSDEFRCYLCGVECATKPNANLAVCEEHCPDHDYAYDPDERSHACRHCGKPMPADWHDCE